VGDFITQNKYIDKMEILKWNDKTYHEIPEQDHPQNGEECLIICKQVYIEPPKINTGEWEVLQWKEDKLDLPNWSIHFVGLFWELEDAELFAEAYSKRVAG
jgi:hypothetical protein